MKITKTTTIGAIATGLSLVTFGMAFAQVGTPVTTASPSHVNATAEITMSVRKGGEIEKGATGFKDQDEHDTDYSEKGEHPDNDKESLMSESHRGAVTTAVQNLLKVADREHGIGSEVKAIAQAQSDSNDTTAAAITRVEGRGGFKAFLFGADYKNIGVIRSEMVKADAQIKQLKALADKTVNVTDKAQLNAQIQALVSDQTKLQTFIASHESKFSVFGWLFKKN